MKFTIDEFYRIHLKEAVRSELNYDNMLYMHIQGDSIVIDANPENSYKSIKPDEINRIALSSEVVRFKLALNSGDELDGEVKNGQLIIPISDKRNEIEISYIRCTDEFNRAVFPQYFRQLIDASVGSQIKFTKCDKGFIMSCDNTGEFFALDALNRIVVPVEIAKNGKVKFTLEDNQILASAA